jgi:hypothetical protein
MLPLIGPALFKMSGRFSSHYPLIMLIELQAYNYHVSCSQSHRIGSRKNYE